MIYYRLLRDNKETGPYSEEEMIAKGFKPYDLLWAEGRSAGWQYPSEIPAFKTHAPIVEEQPYDRFYKKQPVQKLASEDGYSLRSNGNQQPAKITENNVQPPAAQARPNYNYNTQSLPGRHIHVTLPSGNSVNLTTLVAKKEIKEPKEPIETNNAPAHTNSNAVLNGNIKLPVAEMNVINKTETVNEQKVNVAAEKKQPAYIKTVSSAQPVFKNTKDADVSHFSMPAGSEQKNEWKQPQAVYQNKDANTFSWWLILAAVIGIAAMVGLGIMIGLTMNRQKNDLNLNEALNNKNKQAPVQTVVKPEENIVPNVSPSPSAATDETAPVTKPANVKNNELVQNAVVKTNLAGAKNSSAGNTDNTEKKLLMTDKAIVDNNKPIQTQEVTVQHIKPLPAVIDLPTVQRSLSLTVNDFKTGAFGGISGLKCTLYNGSKTPLESVEVEINYIQANDKVYKTEKVLFKDISAGSQTTIDAPASTRGIKITSRIIKVNPRDPALSNITVRS